MEISISPVRARHAARPKNTSPARSCRIRSSTTEAPARLVVNRVSFEPGARTNWHTHPLGQTLYVISGVGRFQTKGGPVHEIRPGDVIWIPPGEKHWHGGAPTTAMTHLAMRKRWMEKPLTGWSR